MSNKQLASPEKSLRLKVGIALASLAIGIIGSWWYWRAPASQSNRNAGKSSALPSSREGGSSSLTDDSPAVSNDERAPETSSEVEIEFPHDMWDPAGITFRPAGFGILSEKIRLTGKITLNEDHVAHLYPLVDGRVDDVLVKLGAHVSKGDVLVIIQSKEIGQAKLQLYQDRLLKEFATVKQKWTDAVSANTTALIEVLKKGESIDIIEEMFRDRPMGEYRAKLLSAYVNLEKSRIDYERMTILSDDGIIPIKQLQAAEAVRNADRAILKAYLEEIDHESRHAAILATQALKEAETRVSVDETNLKILGYSDDELADVDPAREGETLSHYPIQAPFAGTIISKDVVLMERVSTETMILSVADLSTVWVTTDIYEEHLHLLDRLDNQMITLISDAWPDRQFKAQVFYTGDIVDETTRTIGMRAVADNANGLLKPGMFVNVELPAGTEQHVLQVPESALQEENGKPYLFIHLENNRFARRNVTTGRRMGEMIEIKSGVKEVDQIVVTGGFALKSHMLADQMGAE